MRISPNTLYYKPVDWESKDAPVLRLIEKFLEKLPASGLPSVTVHLKKTMTINKKRIKSALDMQKQRILGINSASMKILLKENKLPT